MIITPACTAMLESVPSMPACTAMLESVPSMPACTAMLESVPSMPACTAMLEGVPSTPACTAMLEGVYHTCSMPEFTGTLEGALVICLKIMLPTHKQPKPDRQFREWHQRAIYIRTAAYVPSMNTVAVEGFPVWTRGLTGVCMFTVKSSCSSLNASGMMVMGKH